MVISKAHNVSNRNLRSIGPCCSWPDPARSIAIGQH